MWHLPEIVRLMKSKHAAFAVGDFCQYDTRWVAEAHCFFVHALLRGPCSEASGKALLWEQRFVLAHGVPFTLIAQPYPPKLASALSSTIIGDA